MKDYEKIKVAANMGAKKYLDKQMELLKTFASIDCSTWNEEGNIKVVEILKNVLEDMGCNVKTYHVDGLGTHMTAKLTPKNSTGKIILNGHIDTVFEEGFTKEHPFHIDGYCAYGLGVSDCKGGIVTAIYAVKAMQDAGLLPDKEIEFIFNCDEEIGTASGSKLYKQEAEGADYAFIFEMAEENNGKRAYITSRKGVILGQMDIEGKEAHAGCAYLEGRSAILELAHKIIEFYNFNDYKKGIYYNVAPISGGRPNGIVAGNAHAEFCVAGIPTNTCFAGVEENLRSLENSVTVHGTKIKVQYHTLFPAFEKCEQNHRAYKLLEKPAEILGKDICEFGVDGATDAAYFSSLGIPTVDALGPAGKDIHTVNECMYIPSLRQSTAFFAAVLGCM
ncbi:MAG: M20/M25/M40 family metallo-hydrolase [Clostridia bacterium]|jgi:glutamate carboxypeptidase|nr:M20/M25/M40 family metallo-hydrolase [Clostridia bacterium]